MTTITRTIRIGSQEITLTVSDDCRTEAMDVFLKISAATKAVYPQEPDVGEPAGYEYEGK